MNREGTEKPLESQLTSLKVREFTKVLATSPKSFV